MPLRHLDPNGPGQNEDWEGNNAAFRCPVCRKVFLVSEHLHGNGRQCPGCQKSTGRVRGGRKSHGQATLEWPDSAMPDADHLLDSSAVSFARSLFKAGEGQELSRHEFALASAVSTYYCLFHLGAALFLAYWSSCGSGEDPYASILNKVGKKWSTRKDRLAGTTEYTPDPAQDISHDDIGEFLSHEVPHIGGPLGSRDQEGTLRDMREFASYAPRLYNKGGRPVLYSGCHYRPDVFRSYLRSHLNQMDRFLREAVRWLAENGHRRLRSKLLSANFIVYEFDGLREYYADSTTKQAFSNYRSLCDHEAVDWRVYNPDPDPEVWLTVQHKQRYEEMVRSFV